MFSWWGCEDYDDGAYRMGLVLKAMAELPVL